MKPFISKDQCGNCGECRTICPYDVFAIQDGMMIVMEPEQCIECCACIDCCPSGALSMEE